MASADGRKNRTALALAAAVATLAVVGGVLVLTGALAGDDDPDAFNANTRGVKRLVEALKDDSPDSLYDAVSERARGGLTPTEFTRTYAQQKRRTGAVTEVSAKPPFRARDTADGGVGSAVVRIGYQKRAARDYRAYFLFEDGEWRFWFTGAAGQRPGAER